MARTVDDVLSRRTRTRLLARDASAAAADDVAALIGGELGWSAEERRRQVDGYRRSVAAEREALQSPARVMGPLRTRTPGGGWVPGARPRPAPAGLRPRGSGA